jgi:hypothetical protein
VGSHHLDRAGRSELWLPTRGEQGTLLLDRSTFLLDRGTFLRVLNAWIFAYAASGIPPGPSRGKEGACLPPSPTLKFDVCGDHRRRRAVENRNSSKSR